MKIVGEDAWPQEMHRDAYERGSLSGRYRSANQRGYVADLVDFQSERISIFVERGKSNTARRTVPLADRPRAILE
jgi:hypothetical protein